MARQLVLLSLTESLCLAGERVEAARLQVETGKIAAGTAAACAGDWARGDQHHRAALSRMESVPYVTAQPIARYWYAGMLAERAEPGDIDAAKALLHTSIGVSDTIGLALYAQLARRRLSQIS